MDNIEKRIRLFVHVTMNFRASNKARLLATTSHMAIANYPKENKNDA